MGRIAHARLPPRMHQAQENDLYGTLGVPRSADAVTIKRAFRAHAKRCHPDVDPSPMAGVRFRAVHAAYSTLSDPLLRIAYDARLAARDQRHAPPFRPPRSNGSPSYRQRDQDEGGPDIRIRSWPFIGLHLTGLVFGVLLVLTILSGITFRDWPWTNLPFILPGLLVIPDAWNGLKLVFQRPRQ